MEFMRFWLIRANTLLLELSTVANNSLMIHRINNPVFYQCFYFILFYFVKPSDNRILLIHMVGVRLLYFVIYFI